MISKNYLIITDISMGIFSDVGCIVIKVNMEGNNTVSNSWDFYLIELISF